MAEAVADLEGARRAGGIDRWPVLGHSWGSDLAARYVLDWPEAVTGVIGVAGRGLHKDRTWSQIYEAGKSTEPAVEIPRSREVHQALNSSFIEWIHRPELFRALADTPVPMAFVAAGDDICPDWPLRQLARLVPHGRFRVVEGVPHDFWSAHPEIWRIVVSDACDAFNDLSSVWPEVALCATFDVWPSNCDLLWSPIYQRIALAKTTSRSSG